MRGKMHPFEPRNGDFDVHFASPYEFQEYMRTVIAHGQETTSQVRDSDVNFGFYRAPDPAKIMVGCPTLADEVRASVDRLTAEFPITEHTYMIEPDYVGFVPLVGAALSGDPRAMLRMRATTAETTRAPLEILVNLGVSHSVTDRSLVQRGVMIAAFAILAARTRPVTVVLMGAYKGSRTVVMTVRLELSQSFDLTQLAYLVASPDIPRRHMPRLSGRSGSGIHWGYESNNARLGDVLKAHCALQTNDPLYIQGAYSATGISAVNWIREQLTHINATVKG